MRPLNPIDMAFLGLESRHQPMHVGGLLLFTLPPEAGPNYVWDIVQDMRQSRVMPITPFNQVLRRHVFWEEDQEFDIDQHFRHISLPQPGRIRELLTYVSQEHSALLDRAKPLWECHVIEGIEGNRVAMYFKIHHALVDGIAGMRILRRAMSTRSDERVSLPFWAIGAKKKPRTPRPQQPAASKLEQLTWPLTNLPAVGRELTRSFSERRHDRDYVRITQAPMCILNQSVSASRRFAAQSYALPRLRNIARKMNMTINDIILAMCSGALRAYLLHQCALPRKPLIAVVPVSLRQDDSESGNSISMVLANLATHKADPRQRLEMIHRSMQNAKARFSRMSPDQIMLYSGLVYTLPGLNLVSGILPKIQAFNIVISNVPGPQEPLYWNGMKLDAMYPVSIVMDGQAMNITLTSYLDKLEVGIIACRKALPRIQSLLSLLEDEIQTLEAIADDYVAEQAREASQTADMT